MSVTKKGAYRGRPIVTAVEAKDTGTVQFGGEFELTEYKAPAGWESIEATRMNAYFNLVKTNGGANEINIRNLKESLGWDGASFAGLNRDDWNGTKCQLWVDEEEYQGKKSLKAKYINPFDYEGGGGAIEKADPQVIQSLDQKYGSMLRALGGGKAATMPTATPTTMGKDLAWATFEAMVNEYGRDNPAEAYDEEKRKVVFRAVVTEAAGPGANLKELTPQKWAEINAAIRKDFSAASGCLMPF